MSDDAISSTSAEPWPLVTKALHWIDTSLACNWLLLPLLIGLVTGYLNIGDRAGIAQAAKFAQPIEMQGMLDRGGYRKRQLQLKLSDNTKMPISCGAEYLATRCIPDTHIVRLPFQVTLETFHYRGEVILLSASDSEGRSISSRPFRQWQLNGLDESARSTGWGEAFLFGIELGLVIAAVRYVFFVRRRRRRQLTRANINASK